MSVTININDLTLCHKGSNGISTATIPDVCKTPSPGGPVPLPYPNISMSSDLENGTATVKADGGNMIAIKGSDFSRSTGDEPGTVGGVKSNVNMKESKWILYSFDVKIEGANACRLTDKKTQNSENTVDAMGLVQVVIPPAPYNSGIDCEENKKPRPEGLGWDDCDVKQLCAKVKAVNKQKHDKTAAKPSSDPAYDSTKRKYYKVFATATGAETSMSEAWLNAQFFHPCAKEKWEEGGRDPKPTSEFQADHVHERQLGCNLDDITNFKMLSKSVNGSIGPSLSAYDPTQHSGVALPGCDCSGT
jgi:hypothetical protein